jgi:hypothetical protein
MVMPTVTRAPFAGVTALPFRIEFLPIGHVHRGAGNYIKEILVLAN